MKTTYVLTVELDQGNDEFWEAIAQMKRRQAKTEVAHEVQNCLADRGYIKPFCRVKTLLVRHS